MSGPIPGNESYDPFFGMSLLQLVWLLIVTVLYRLGLSAVYLFHYWANAIWIYGLIYFMPAYMMLRHIKRRRSGL